MNRSSNLTPFAGFITILGVIFMPLSRLGGVYAWPCGRIALSICLFYVGCVIAEWLKGKLNSRWLIGISIAAVLCFGQKYFLESMPQLPINDHIYWYHRHLASLGWLIYYLSFLLMGIIVNSPMPLKEEDNDVPKKTSSLIYPFRSNQERFWKDFANGTACFSLYMVMSILPYVTEFYTTASKTLILSIRIVSVVPWVTTLIYVYRCVMSEKISILTMKLPKLAMFISSLCPGAIFLIVVNAAHNWTILGVIIVMPIMTYILSISWRFSVRLFVSLYKLLVYKDFEWEKNFCEKY